MTTDFYNLLLSDCGLAVVLLVLFWYVQRISRGLRGIAAWGVAHLLYSLGAAMLDGTSQQLTRSGDLHSAYWIAGIGGLLACGGVAGLALSIIQFVRQRALSRLEWALVPVSKAAGMVENFQSYERIYEQNQELKRELQKMTAWKEAARQLGEQNARLLDLNKVRLDPKLTWVTGQVLADSGSPFRQSVLLNVGARDGIRDGWATMDGLGFVRELHGSARWAGIPLVIVTADQTPGVRQAARDSGADDFIAKPFDYAAVKNTLNRWQLSQRSHL